MARRKDSRCEQCGWLGYVPLKGFEPQAGVHTCPRHRDAEMITWKQKYVYCLHLVENAIRDGINIKTWAEEIPEVDVKGFTRADLAYVCALVIDWEWPRIAAVELPTKGLGFNPLYEDRRKA